MANSFNTSQTTITSTNSPVTVFTASASTTLIKSIRVMHGSSTSSATLAITKFGGNRTDMNTVTLSAGVTADLITDVLPLAANDIITVESTHQPTYVWVSYVENVTAVNGQSIDVLNDVDTTTVLPTSGQALVWDGSQWEPGTVASGSTAMDDLTDVSAPSPNNSDVLKWTSVPGRWEPVDWLAVMYAEFKQGTSSTVNNGGGTDSSLVLDTTTAKLKTGITEVKLTETSPGDIEFIVATDAAGTTAFTALHIDGTTTASDAEILVKPGAKLIFEDGTYTQWLKPSTSATADFTVNMPNKTGTLALESGIPTSVTDLTDVTSAGSGAIITSAERTKLTGIAAGAEVNVNADWNATSGDAQILNKPTIPTNTNLGNANLTADDNRTYDTDGNTLTVDINGGEFAISDSSAVDTYVLCSNNVLELGDTGMIVQASGVLQAKRGTEQDEANLTTDGAFGAGAEITYLGSSATSVFQGRVYYYNGTTWTAFTSATEAPQKALLGIAAGTTMDKGFILRGFINPDSGTLTAGAQVFGATNATVVSTAPGTGQFQRVLGHAISTRVIHFNPSQEYLEIA